MAITTRLEVSLFLFLFFITLCFSSGNPNPGSVPNNNPVINQVTNQTTPGTTIPGQSWCIAKGGIPETALQAALDYACGIVGADCAATQQGGICYDPNTLQNHASYAFNSYYLKNPGPTSCDFGGVAMISTTNPSVGSCVYPTSASSTPVTANLPPGSPTQTTPGAGGVTGIPSVLNSSNPSSGFPESSSGFNDTSSKSSNLKASISCFILVTSIITLKLF